MDRMLANKLNVFVLKQERNVARPGQRFKRSMDRRFAEVQSRMDATDARINNANRKRSERGSGTSRSTARAERGTVPSHLAFLAYSRRVLFLTYPQILVRVSANYLTARVIISEPMTPDVPLFRAAAAAVRTSNCVN